MAAHRQDAVILLSILLVACAAVFFWGRRRWRAFSAKRGIARALGAARSGPARAFVRDGLEYRYLFQLPLRRDTGTHKFRLWTACPSEHGFQARGEGTADRLAKRTGFSSEVQTGDAEFDRRFYLSTDHPPFAAACFAAPEKREALRALFGLGAGRVTLHRGTLEAAWEFHREPTALGFTAQTIEQALPHLNALAADLPRVPASPDAAAWRGHHLASGLALASFFAGVSLWMEGIGCPPLDYLPIVSSSLAYSLPPLALFLGLAVRLLRGHSSAHRGLFLILVFSAPGFLLGGLGVQFIRNNHPDQAPPAVHRALVVEKPAAGRSSQYLVLQSWRPGNRTETLRVSGDLHRRAEPNRTWMRVVTRPGALGYECLLSHEIDESGAGGRGKEK